MFTSTQNYLKDPVVPIQSLPSASAESAHVGPLKANQFTFSAWPTTFFGETQLLDELLAGRKFQPFKVDTAEADSIESKYLEPVVNVAYQDFIDSKTTGLEMKIKHGFQEGVQVVEIYLTNLSDHEIHDKYPNMDLVGVAMFVPPGSIPKRDFEDEYPIKATLNDFMASHVLELVSCCHKSDCPFGVLTDEYVAVVFDLRIGNYSTNSPNSLMLEVYDCHQLTIRTILAFFAFTGASRAHVRVYPGDDFGSYKGALNETPYSKQPVDEMTHIKHSFRDFDVFTMQRDTQAWFDFCQWRSLAMRQAEDHPLAPGDTLPVERNTFIRRLVPMRSLLGDHYWNTNLQTTPQYRRPRSETLDTFLNSDVDLRFEITETRRTGPKHYSQVVFGRFVGCSDAVCVKIFEERMFPVFQEPDYLEMAPEKRLLNLIFADDLARREESVYDRLQHLQGTFIPHSYGFHTFTLPDGWECIALVMEVIDGPLLLDSGVEDLETDAQVDFIKRLRAAVGAISSAGVSQLDWHLDQILCPKSSTDLSQAPDVVFVDFAFAFLRLGDCSFDPPLKNIIVLETLLIFESPLNSELVENHWPDRNEDEDR